MFAFYFTGHGDRTKLGKDVLIGVDGHPVNTDTIIDQFSPSECTELAGKPKMAIFDCCRGSRGSVAVNALNDDSEEEEEDSEEEGAAGSAAAAASAPTKKKSLHSLVGTLNVDYANWWIMHAVPSGHGAPAEMHGSEYSPLTHYLAPLLQALPDHPDGRLADVLNDVNDAIHQDIQQRKVEPFAAEMRGNTRFRIAFRRGADEPSDSPSTGGHGSAAVTPFPDESYASPKQKKHRYTRAELEAEILSPKLGAKGLWAIADELGALTLTQAKKTRRADVIEAILNSQR